MTNYNTLGNHLKARFLRFINKFSKNFNKTTRKFIADMLFGMIAAKSCKLTDISRALKESIALKKTTERLGRNLSSFSEKDRETLMKEYLSAVKGSVGPDTMLLIDGGDAIKQCSPKMESIGFVRDGSTGKYAPGYWTMSATALSDENRQPIPVYENLYPCKKQGGLGYNAEVTKCLQSLRENFDANQPRVFDRGFDTLGIVKNLFENGEKFILRANQNRAVIHKGKRSYINDIARNVVCEHILIYKSKSGNRVECRIGMTQVTVPSFNNMKLNLVVCKGFGEPLVLYSNLSETLETTAIRVVKIYLMRWRIEEFYAFKKQGLNFEDFRVRGLNSIKNLDTLLTIAIGFIGTLGEEIGSDIVVKLIAISKRIEKISVYLKKTKFLFYAILGGLITVFASLRCGISHYFAPITRDPQLHFALC